LILKGFSERKVFKDLKVIKGGYRPFELFFFFKHGEKEFAGPTLVVFREVISPWRL